MFLKLAAMINCNESSFLKIKLSSLFTKKSLQLKICFILKRIRYHIVNSPIVPIERLEFEKPTIIILPNTIYYEAFLQTSQVDVK